MDPGLAEARSSRPNQSRNASSSLRLGALKGTSTPLPQPASTAARNLAQPSAGTDQGSALTDAKLPHSTRAAVRSGYAAENVSDIEPPSDQPKIAARDEPAASITARTSPMRSSSVCSPTRSESPWPRLSKTMTL